MMRPRLSLRVKSPLRAERASAKPFSTARRNGHARVQPAIKIEVPPRHQQQVRALAEFGIAHRLRENFVCAFDESPRCWQVAMAELVPSIDKDFESRAPASSATPAKGI